VRRKYYKFSSFLFLLILVSNPIFSSETVNSNKIQSNILNKSYFKIIKENSYIIGPGDSLEVRVSRNYSELDALTNIDGDGTISLPLVGRIYVKGLTISELTKLLNESYEEYINYPEVEIKVSIHRPVKVFVKGEVNDPGLYTLKGSLRSNTKFNNELNENIEIYDSLNTFDLPKSERSFNPKFNNLSYYFPTVYDAIRASGGITQYSDLSSIKVIRLNSISNGGGKKITTLNFKDIFEGTSMDQNIRVYDGDIINISSSSNPDKTLVGSAIKTNLNPKYINVLVTGRVMSPGKITIGKSSTLNDAVEIAGSKTLKGPIRYITYAKDGTLENRKIKFKRNRKRGSYSNPFLKNGDIVIVGKSGLNVTTELIKEITDPLQGIYSTYRLIELFGD